MGIYLIEEKQGEGAKIYNIVYGEEIDSVKRRNPSKIVVRLNDIDIERIEAMRGGRD